MRHLRLYYQRAERNFGDLLSPLIVEDLTGRPTAFSKPQNADLVAIGSLLERVQAKKWRRLLMGRFDPLPIWGTGYLRPGPPDATTFLTALAVRGVKTQTRLQPARPSCPTLGDPGLLANRLVPRNTVPSGVLIAPHLSNQGTPELEEFLQKCLFNYSTVQLNDAPLKILEKISSATLVISSAMHPIIAAHSFGVPAIWADFGTGVEGGGYKFLDYYSIFGIEPYQWRHSDIKKIKLNDVMDLAMQYHPHENSILKVQNQLAMTLCNHFGP